MDLGANQGDASRGNGSLEEVLPARMRHDGIGGEDDAAVRVANLHVAGRQAVQQIPFQRSDFEAAVKSVTKLTL